MVKEKYHSCDLCFHENKEPGKNKVKFKYRKDEKVLTGTMDICPECAAAFDPNEKKEPRN